MAELALFGGTPVRTKPMMSWPHFDEREVDAVCEVIRSGKWGRYEGTYVVEFERAFAQAQGAEYAIAVTNGTTALEVPLAIMGVGPGDEVIVPSYTFIATASAVLMHGATPVFVDVQPDTWNMDPACFEAAITEKTKVVVPVHFGGMPADLDEIMTIADMHGIDVLEDAAHAHGGSYKGRKMGSMGRAAGFSFQSSKNITAGEGGAITTSDADMAERMFSRHTFGRMPGRPWYEHHVIGTNTRMTEMQAAILLIQLSRMDQHARERLANAAILDKAIGAHAEELAIMRPANEASKDRAYHLYMYKYLGGGKLSGISREDFAAALRAEGVYANVGYDIPLYKQAMFSSAPRGLKQSVPYDRMFQPVVEKAVKESLWFGQSSLVGDSSQADDIVEAIEKIIKNADELRVK